MELDLRSNEIFNGSESRKFTYMSKYSRWIDDLGRREFWPETVDRYLKWIYSKDHKIPENIKKLIQKHLLNMTALPSMRAVWTAGIAAQKCNVGMYGCAYVAVDDIQVFGEILYILMCCTGVGFSVESEFIDKLPEVPHLGPQKYGTFQVDDSREGWKESVDILFECYFKGMDIDFNYDGLRPEGAKLKTMGGRASEPEPLKKLHIFIKETLINAAGRKLTDIEIHDIICEIGDIVVVGGVRRSSEISFSDLESEAMRYAKHGNFLSRRWMANNTAVYKKKPTSIEFLKEWTALAESNSGERGILNVTNFQKFAPRRKFTKKERTNPCGEIILKSMQFCNLSEIVVRAGDTFDDLIEKAKVAVWLGMIQSTFTHFPFLRPQWKKNCEEDRLLGVSITGQKDNPKILTAEKLAILKEFVIKTAQKASKALEINMPAALTCSKPSGNGSQLLECASGLHARYSAYYLRRHRLNTIDPLYGVLKESGYKVVPDVGEPKKGARKNVIEFPIKSPKGSILRDDESVIDQLEWYKKIQNNWCEHNASCTVYVKEEEWIEVGKWVYENWDYIVGITFMPYDGGTYELAPYEEITKEEYEDYLKKMNGIGIDYRLLEKYEQEDQTNGSREYACQGDKCEI